MSLRKIALTVFVLVLGLAAPLASTLLTNWRSNVVVADGGGPPPPPYSPEHAIGLDGGGPPPPPYSPTHASVLS